MSVSIRIMLRRGLFWLLVVLAVVAPAPCWGPEGHRAVAMIAAKHLTPEVRDAVQAIIGPTNTLAAISVWADDIRDEHPETAPWHYIDIPLMAAKIDMSRDCAGGNCVVAKIAEFESTLKNKSGDPARRREALKFLAHFVGDLHQPLHCEDNNDKGGNTVQVVFFGQPTNLHALWDGGNLRRERLWGARFADDLNGRITAAERTAWAQGSPQDWALESHALAAQVAYGKLPHEATPNLGEDYSIATLPVIEQQIKRAGIRLAYLLNQALQQKK